SLVARPVFRWCCHKKPKKSTWKFNLDLTHPVEDRIF
ncbi:hypothetical protein DBR06_SOUSAS15110029, partial [Sousa chinensis]